MPEFTSPQGEVIMLGYGGGTGLVAVKNQSKAVARAQLIPPVFQLRGQPSCFAFRAYLHALSPRIASFK